MSWTALGMLGLAVLVFGFLPELAETTRRHEDPDAAVGRIEDDYDQALDWGIEIVGLATALAGFLGIARGAGAAARGESPEGAATGLAGVLAGATILGLGSWAAPAALGTLVIGVGAIRVMKAARGIA